MTRITLLALLLACGTAQADEWVSLVKVNAAKKMEVLVDVSNIQSKDGIRHAWIKMVYASQTESGAGSDSAKWVRYDLTRWAFNCNEQTASAEALEIAYEDGTQEEDNAAPWPKPWRPIPPETVMSAGMQFVCAWKPK
jgi:hypothetical protein